MKILAVIKDNKVMGYVDINEVYPQQTFVATNQFTTDGTPVNLTQFKVSKNQQFLQKAKKHSVQFWLKDTPDGKVFTWTDHAFPNW